MSLTSSPTALAEAPALIPSQDPVPTAAPPAPALAGQQVAFNTAIADTLTAPAGHVSLADEASPPEFERRASFGGWREPEADTDGREPMAEYSSDDFKRDLGGGTYM